MSYESFIRSIAAPFKDAIEVSKSVKKEAVPMPTKSTESCKTSPQVQSQPIANTLVASTYELNQFSDYICRAKDGIPPNKNLRRDITPIGLPVRKTGDSTYDFKLFKIKNGEDFERTSFHQFLKPQMNQAFEKIRSMAKCNLLQERQILKNALQNAYFNFSSPTSPFFQNDIYYNKAYNNAYENYNTYLIKHSHLLYRLRITGFIDYDDCIVISVRCDYSYRISV